MIRVLSVDVANRIAAGEVVDRPAAVVKELVENALDAGAREISVDLEEGGVRLVRVVDDGGGMSPEDLATSVLPHATSKIADVDDLERVATFGFRGEALPSIGAVARLEITSRPRGAALGARLVVEGGATTGPDPVGAAFGTTCEVRNLFFNVPARRKFLKQDRTETAHALETLTRLALPDPGWGLRVANAGRRTLEAPAVADRRARVAAFFGAEFAARLKEATGARGSARLHALFGPPDLVRPNASRQYLFLNGRWIRDRRLSHAIQESYRGMTMPRDYPVAFLFLEADPATVDVNVHPTKAEVRFRDPDLLHALVVRTLRGALDAAPAARSWFPPSGAEAPAGEPARIPAATSRAREDAAFAFGAAASSGAAGAEPATDARPASGTAPPFGADRAPPPKFAATTLARSLFPEGPPTPSRFLQMHRSYVVAEVPEGIRIVDQHALHERKLYDELRARAAAGTAEDQLLLVPEAVEPGPAERALLLEFAPEFARLGLRLEAFGSRGVALRSVPAALRRARPEALLATALELVREGPGARRDALLDDAIATFACKAAVKFHDALPPEEVRALLAYEAEHPEARNCPHGRTTALVLTLRDLEARFQRKK